MKKRNRWYNFALDTRRGNRPVNQDALMCAYNKAGELCAIVCDGVGSINNSQVAAQVTVKVFTDEFAKLEKVNDAIGWFKTTLQKCMAELTKVSQEKNLPDISTTLALLIVTKEDKYYSFNIGDTRIYRIDDKSAKIISFDHNYKNYLIRQGASRENIEAAKAKWNSLTNFLDPSHPEFAKFETNSGDITGLVLFTICTDGMYNSFNCQELQKIVYTKHIFPLSIKAYKLIRFCEKKDKSDNLSCIIVAVK